MKDTDHLIRHPRRHLGGRASAQRTRVCARRKDQVGRGQNTGMGWSDPTFAHDYVAKVMPWVAPAHIEIPSGVLPVCVAGFERRQVKEEGDSREEGKNYPLHFEFPPLHPTCGVPNSFPIIYNNYRCESQRARKVKPGGSNPTFSRRPARKFCRVAPALGSAPRRRFAQLHMLAQEFVRQNV